MPVRSYIFTRRERERLLRWLEEGFEDDATPLQRPNPNAEGDEGAYA